MEDNGIAQWRKSIHSSNGGGNCVEVASWRTSSYSSNGQATCVETASGQGVVLVRDTTNRDGGTLAFTSDAWQRFASRLK
jgi:hypothetical protein